MADAGDLRMNVAALKRFDPYARDIVDSATHVALYRFHENEWEKTSIEGALFVYSRNGKPFYSMIIMNRLNTTNQVEPVTQGLELQVQEPFLLYRNAKRRIFGIWFYDKDECVRIANRINTLSKESSNNNNVTSTEPAPKMKTSIASGSVDIFSMLSKAQDDYNTNKGLPSTNKSEPQAPRAPDVTSQSVMDFFAKAGGGGVHIPTVPPAQAANLFGVPRPSVTDAQEGPMLLQRLMSNPVHSVEHIEKQQRSVTPGDPAAVASSSLGTCDNKRSNSGLKLKSTPGDSKRKNSQTKTPQNLVGKADTNSATNPVTEINGQSSLENEMNFIRVSSPKITSPLTNFFNQSQIKTTEESETKLTQVTCETPQKPALMPPTMFTSSASKGTERPTLDAVLTPIRSVGEDLRLEPLTRNQLLQAFNYLIKNDADFMNKLHEAYIKSFSELVS